MNDRDHFSAAALTGLLAVMRGEDMDELCGAAYGWADAMLAERDKTSVEADKHRGNVTPGDTSPERVVTYADSQHDKKRIVSDRFHDAVPAARATAESVGTDKAEPLTRQQTGNPGERRGTGNTQDWHTTPSVVSVPTQRTVGGAHDRPEPVKERVSDRSKPIEVGEELATRLRKINDTIEREPVAWAVMIGARQYDVYETQGEAEAIAHWLRVDDEGDWQAVPLYAHPQQDRVVRLPSSWAKLDDCEMVGVKRVTAALDAAGVNWRFG